MKNNLSYYRHQADAHNHPKFKMLRAKYGWAGEGKFWALNNMIAKAENCKLDLNEKFLRGAACGDLNFSFEELDEYISFLCNECKLIQYEDGVIFTNDTQDCLVDVSSDRISARERYLNRINRQKEAGKTNSPEKEETSPENVQTSPDAGYTVKSSNSNTSKTSESSSSRAVYDDHDFLTFTLFTEEPATRAEITKLFHEFCNKEPHPGELTRIWNIMESSDLGAKETWAIIVRSFKGFPLLGEQKRNTQYLGRQIEKRIEDDVGKLRAKAAKLKKAREAQDLDKLKTEWQEAEKAGNTPYQQFLKNQAAELSTPAGPPCLTSGQEEIIN